MQYSLGKYIFGAPWIQGADEPSAAEFTQFLLDGIRNKSKPASRKK
jgi:hypothetical protein